MTRARQLRDRVAFEARETVVDDLGSVQGEFVERFACAAEIRAKLGGEAVAAARLAGQQPVLITVRQAAVTADLTTEWRARDTRRGTIYNIRSIADPDPATRIWLELLCQSGVAT
jgi:head-tail adaptor